MRRVKLLTVENSSWQPNELISALSESGAVDYRATFHLAFGSHKEVHHLPNPFCVSLFVSSPPFVVYVTKSSSLARRLQHLISGVNETRLLGLLRKNSGFCITTQFNQIRKAFLQRLYLLLFHRLTMLKGQRG